MISRAAIRDAIRRQAFLTDLSDKPVRRNGLTTDAGETAFFELQLTDIDAKLYNVQYPELNMNTIVPVKSDINPGADFYTWRGYDKKGDVSETDDYDDDVQEVEILGGQATAQRITGIRGSFGYSIMDIRRAQMAGVPLEAQKALAAREFMEKKLDQMMAIGSAVRSNNSIYGFFNHPAVIGGTGSVNAQYDIATNNTGAYGAAGSWFASSTGVDWSMTQATGKAVNAIVKDLNNMYNTVRLNSKYIARPNTLTLDERTHDLFMQTPANLGDPLVINSEMVMGYILRNCAWIKKVQKTIQANYASGTAANQGVQGLGLAIVMLHEEGAEHGEFLLPQPFEIFPPQLRGMKFMTSMHIRAGGFVVRHPERFITAIHPQGTTSY